MLEEILRFLIHHWALSLALILTLTLLFWEETRNKAGGLRISLSDATNLINRNHAVLIDLRDSDTFNSGHVLNALNFPQTDIMHQLEKLKKYRDKPIILLDNTGQHALLIANKLLKQGFNKTYCLAGGLKTWLNAGLPLTKSGQ